MTLLVSVNDTGMNWKTEPWEKRFRERLGDAAVVGVAAAEADAGSVRYAAVWKPAPGLLRRFPGLRAIFNLGAGADALMADATLPDVPVVRVVDPDLTGRMTEYVVLHVLRIHRRDLALAAAQAGKVWLKDPQWPARQLRVGIMGLGVLGRDAAEVLIRIGFDVAGWSRTPRDVPGVTCFSGADGLRAFLARTDVLVVLLPLTPDTKGILARPLFLQLARDGVLAAPAIINAGRGGLQVEADILAALDDGTLSAAVLDVFETEPLPEASRLWSHPNVTVTPHNAADSDAEAISDYVVGQIRAHEAGRPLQNVIDRRTGY